MKADVKEADDNSRPGANQNRTQSEQRRTERELEGLNAELLRQAAYLRQVNQTLLDSEHRLRLAIEDRKNRIVGLELDGLGKCRRLVDPVERDLWVTPRCRGHSRHVSEVCTPGRS